MSRTKDDYIDHMNSGGDEQCCRTCPSKKATADKIEEAIQLLTQHGHTVVPPTADLTAN